MKAGVFKIKINWKKKRKQILFPSEYLLSKTTNFMENDLHY